MSEQDTQAEIDSIDVAMTEPAKQVGAVKYIGTRPFKQNSTDEPVLPGDIVGAGHQYEPIINSLALRADFVEVNNG